MKRKVYKIEKNCTECSNFYQEDSCCECDAEEALFGTDRCECCIYHIVEETFKDRMESDLGTKCFKDYDEAAAMLRAFTKAG